MTAAITPDDFSDAIALLHREGINAVLDAFPSLKDHRVLVRELAVFIEDHETLELLITRAADRVNAAELKLRASAVEEVAG